METDNYLQPESLHTPTNIQDLAPVFKEVDKRLEEFEPVSLEQMDDVKLMNRTDTKFTFRLSLLPLILSDIQTYYRALEINGVRCSRYESLYYDTADFSLYNQHHAGKLNRYKIRFRKYVDSETSYFEVKFKNNKGRTIKDRVKKKIGMEIKGKARKLLCSKTPLDYQQFIPKIWINYSRITLVSKVSKERLTIDLNLTFKYSEMEVHYPNLVIAELKQESHANSIFRQIMKKYLVREGSISKYCLGIANIYDNVKKNNFKAKILKLKHLGL